MRVVAHVRAIVPGLNFVHPKNNAVNVSDFCSLLKVLFRDVLRPNFLRSVSRVGFFPTTMSVSCNNPLIF